jgi:short-subunit dehydrogenase
MDITNKNIILTGAASGIGRALLEQLATVPCRILAVDLNPAALEEACAALTGKPAAVTSFVCDLSSRENVDRLFDEAIQSMGRVDLFFANAGFAYYEQIEQPDWEHIEKIYRVNVFNTIYTIEKMESLFADKPYKVVVTASAMAFIAVPGYAIYSSTKAALDRFADAYRWQVKDPRKLVMVYPIGTRTGFFRAAGHNVPEAWPTQTPETVARAILRCVKADRKTVYPSALFSLVMFLDRFLPMHRLEQSMEQKRLEGWLAEK